MMNVQRMMELINEHGLVQVVHDVIGSNVSVEIWFDGCVCKTSIDEISFSVRSLNALKRAGLFTIGDVVDAIANDGLLCIRNLGRKSVNEIKTRILAYGFEKLSANDKVEFIRRLLNSNSVVIGG